MENESNPTDITQFGPGVGFEQLQALMGQTSLLRHLTSQPWVSSRMRLAGVHPVETVAIRKPSGAKAFIPKAEFKAALPGTYVKWRDEIKDPDDEEAPDGEEVKSKKKKNGKAGK